MLIPSHLSLAKKLLSKTRNYSNNLNKIAFYWGNIRPDIHSPFNRGKHKYEISLDIIEKKWQKLEETPAACSLLCSYRLGVILHYIADFFCYAHNNEYYDNNLKAHLIYEQKLHGEISAIEGIEQGYGSPEDIKAYLGRQREIYFKGRPSPRRDCDFICQCTWAMTQWAMLPVVERRLVFA